MLVKKTIDVTQEPTQEQINMLIEAEKRPIVFDEDCPELTDEELAQFYRVSETYRDGCRKQAVILQLSPQTLVTAKTLGKSYTDVLSRILENVLKDKEATKRYL